jgi:hypothetical protein
MNAYRFQIFVTTKSDGNAESGPGGYIYVDKDMHLGHGTQSMSAHAVCAKPKGAANTPRTRHILHGDEAPTIVPSPSVSRPIGGE